MQTTSSQNQERQYYLDWLRILLIISVYLFHIGMVFNTWHWHVKNDTLYGGMLKETMNFLHIWRMPLLFMVSGAGTYYALGKRRPGQYLSERFRRLIIPLIIGIFTLVPVQVYIEKSAQYSSLFDFYRHMFEGIYPEGNFSWHHLWFIAYLFVISLIISPFLNMLRSNGFRRFTEWLTPFVSKPLALNIFLVPLLLSQIILRNYFENGTNDLINDWASITYYVIFFLSGFILLPVSSITDSIKRFRFWYLAETIVAVAVVFGTQYLTVSEPLAEIIVDVAEVFLAWSCGLTAIGFAKRYLNINSRFRLLANEAIYPFYLLHQPVIVVTGFFVVSLNIPDLLKALLILMTSASFIVVTYWFLIRPFNVFRLAFGLKVIRSKKSDKSDCLENKQVAA